jgi:hypothetical protein
MIMGFDKYRQMLVVGCSNKGICPPLDFFPAFAEAMKKTNPTQITAVFFEPPLGVGTVTVQIFDRDSTLKG